MNEFDHGSAEVNQILRARQDLRDAAGLLKRFRESGTQGLRLLAGEALDDMLRSYESTVERLSAPHGDLRLAALLLIKEYWSPRRGFWEQCQRIAFDDPDPRVRGAAIFTLMRCSSELPRSAIETLAAIGNVAADRLSSDLDSQLAASAERKAQIEEDGRRRRLRIWRNLVGPSYDDLIAHPELVSTYFVDPNPTVRLAALSLGESDSNLTPEFLKSSETLAMTDPEVVVQTSAISLLARVHAGTNDRTIGARMAELVKDNLRPAAVRQTAYSALFQLRGLPVSAWPIMARRNAEPRFPDSVDWSLVDSFLL